MGEVLMQYSAGDLQAACEKGREIGDSTAARLSVTGEPYVVIGHQISFPPEPGVVAEGEEQELAFDAETAYFSALNAFLLYGENRLGKLYWRVKPKLEWNRERCRFYLRLLISDRPEIAA